MEKKSLRKTGVGRRSFLSGSSLLLTGALLGASEEMEAKEEQTRIAPSATPQDKDSLFADLVAANRILADQGVVDGYGHVSVRHPTNPDHFYISRWLAPDLVTESDIVELDLDCVPVTGDKRRLYSERFIHSEIYKVRPDVKSVVHTHAPTVVLMGVCGEPLVPIYHMTGFDIRYSQIIRNDEHVDHGRGERQSFSADARRSQRGAHAWTWRNYRGNQFVPFSRPQRLFEN